MNAVVDVSVVVKWFVAESLAAQAEALAGGATPLIAPDFLSIEFANVLWKKVTRGEVTAENAVGMLHRLSAMPVKQVDSSPLLPRAMELATTTRRTVYDCLYLALAISRSAMLITADERFVNAIRATRWRGHVIWLGAPRPNGPLGEAN